MVVVATTFTVRPAFTAAAHVIVDLRALMQTTVRLDVLGVEHTTRIDLARRREAADLKDLAALGILPAELIALELLEV